MRSHPRFLHLPRLHERGPSLTVLQSDTPLVRSIVLTERNFIVHGALRTRLAGEHSLYSMLSFLISFFLYLYFDCGWSRFQPFPPLFPPQRAFSPFDLSNSLPWPKACRRLRASKLLNRWSFKMIKTSTGTKRHGMLSSVSTWRFDPLALEIKGKMQHRRFKNGRLDNLG